VGRLGLEGALENSTPHVPWAGARALLGLVHMLWFKNRFA
jgi:hypothetical protein